MNTAEKLTAIAENQKKVYDKGRDDLLDVLWENIQNSGKRTNYREAFCHKDQTYMYSWKVWTDEFFAPKYDFKITDAYRMFQNAGIRDLKGCLAKHGVTIDLGGCKTASSVDMTFYFSNIEELPEVNVSNVPGRLVETICWNERLKKVDKVILSPDGNQTFYNTFTNNKQLTDIIFEGKFGHSVNFNGTPLNVASMKSLISCLKDYSVENTGVNILTLTDQCKTALEAEGATSPNGNLWTEYVSDLGWVLA